MGQSTQKRQTRVVRLLQNTIYPTYWLYAQMDNGRTTPQAGLRLAALITLRWVKARLNDAVMERQAELSEAVDKACKTLSGYLQQFLMFVLRILCNLERHVPPAPYATELYVMPHVVATSSGSSVLHILNILQSA